MDTRKRSVDGLDEGRNCVLQRNACSKHGGECPNSWIMVPQVHDFLHQFPGDLQQMIIAETVVPTARCIKQVFDHCYDPWTCQDGAHTYEFSPLLDFDSGMAPCTPSMCYTSRCELIRKEGYKAFFLNNVFIFRSNHSTSTRPLFFLEPEHDREWLHDMDFLGRRERDYRATRLLDFIDSPNLRGKGSMEFQLRLARFDDGSYNNVDQYRYTIRHLVFMVGYEGMPFCSLAFQYNWAWALTVDWKTLPNLQTLVLDLRGYSYRQLQVPELPQELYDEQLESGAKQMEYLKLKSLIIYGLCSGPKYWDKGQHRRRMEKLFAPALGKWGTLELRDQEHFVNW
ncbi:hypothetical protein L207DRAFT_505586 [Hyaloscypha variabilis F]|uniref:Uncharacterized protein n=1 Tax=Hyaloscypha variabilis (strain UAMH 11265 / GT02V1 / F) TaxID=1149755 RepID=A0A2J6SCR3_HYAVF|nr:hypothetical protein L207DRAFT_505586 [Hyaloscypha variabilis F]